MDRRLKDLAQKSISFAYRSLKKPGFTQGHRCLLFHSIGSRLPWDREKIFSVDPDLFRIFASDLALKRDAGVLTTAFCSEVESFDSLTVSLTLDDGYHDNMANLLPILEQYSIPATVFVCLEFIESGDPLYMNKEQLLNLSKSPLIQIGSHALRHQPLDEKSEKEIKTELSESRDQLEQLLGRSIKTIAYPFSRHDERVVRLAFESGYTHGFTARGEINRAETPKLLMGRTEILGTDTLKTFQWKLEGAWDWYRWKTLRLPFALK